MQGDTSLDSSVKVFSETVTGNTYPEYEWSHPVGREPRLNKTEESSASTRKSKWETRFEYCG